LDELTADVKGDTPLSMDDEDEKLAEGTEDASMSVTVGDIMEGEDAIVNVSLESDATGDVSVGLTGANLAEPVIYVSTVTDGLASFLFLNLLAGNYTVTTTYPGDGKYASATINETLTVMPGVMFKNLQTLINDDTTGEITLDRDYYGNSTEIVISKNITINGNGHTLNANGSSRIFHITAGYVVINNLTFVNSFTESDGGAVYFDSGSTGIVRNCNFTNNTINGNYYVGGAVCFSDDSYGTVTNCNFVNNTVSENGCCIVYFDNGTLTNCNFTGNNGDSVWFHTSGVVLNCDFTNNFGNAIYVYTMNSSCNVADCNFTNTSGESVNVRRGNVTNCKFTNSRMSAVGMREGNLINCSFTNNNVISLSQGNVINCSFAYNYNSDEDGGAITIDSGNVTGCSFIGNSAFRNGGAITIDSGNVTGCYFANNTVYLGGGGAIFFKNFGNVMDCNFIDNMASKEGGGVSFHNGGTITNCNFTNNTATDGGGAICFSYSNYGAIGNVINCNFTNNSANMGGAIHSICPGNVTDCNFADNAATGNNSVGGAVYFESSGYVENCNFVNNTADGDGGAINFEGEDGILFDSVFTSNTAGGDGGAINFEGEDGILFDSVFTSNTAGGDGGAINWRGDDGILFDSVFTSNTAGGNGGAIYLEGNRFEVSDSSFSDSYAARSGGAMFCTGSYSIAFNSNFTNNLAEYDGGAIYWYGGEMSKYNDVYGCRFIGNVAHALQDISRRTYGGGAICWSENGEYCFIENSEFYNNSVQSAIGKADGGAVLLDYDNHVLIDNCVFESNYVTTAATGDIWVQGGAIFLRSKYNCTISNCVFRNCSSDKEAGALYIQYSNSMRGFIVNTTFINNVAKGIDKNVNGGGAVQIKDVNSEVLFDNVTFINNTANKGGAVSFLHNIMNGRVVFTGCNFDGNEATEDGGAVQINNTRFPVLFDNVTFRNNTANKGGAIAIFDDNNRVGFSDCNFDGNEAVEDGGAIWVMSGNVTNCNFTNNNAANGEGGAILMMSGSITHCNFTNNIAGEAGAVFLSDAGNVADCIFVNNTALAMAGAILMMSGNVADCIFVNNTADADGGAIWGCDNVENCNFTGNSATSASGGAIYWISDYGNLTNSIFIGNTALHGGAIHWGGKNGTITGSLFSNNTAENEGGAIYCYDQTDVTIIDSKFAKNSAGENGGAIYGNLNVTIGHSSFTDNTANLGGAIYNCTHEMCTFEANAEPQIYPNSKMDAPMTITVEIGEDLMVIVTLPSDATGNITVTGMIQFAYTTATITNGSCIIPARASSAGQYEIRADYGGDVNYLANSTAVNITVPKKNTPMTITAEVGEDLMVNVTLPSDATGTVNITVDGMNYALAIVDGLRTLYVSGLSAGEYDIMASYGGDENYLPTSNSTHVTISKTEPVITVDANNVEYGQTESVKVTLPSDATGSVEFTLLNGNSQVIDNKNSILTGGTASYTLPELNVGRYTLNTQYFGDSRYEGSLSCSTFYVSPKISITPDVTIGDDGVITMDLGNVTGSIIVYLDWEKDGSQTIRQGKFVYHLPTWAMTVGNHTIYFQYEGNSFDENVFNQWSNETGKYEPILYHFFIHKKQSESEAETKGEILEVILEDENGNVLVNATGNIEFTILNEFTHEISKVVVEIVNGIASLDISQFKDGSYIISWYYAGDDKHVPMSDTKVLEISRKVSRITAGDLSMVYSSSQAYSVTVYGADGYPVSGVPVIFLINNRAFRTVTTDRNGFASVAVTQAPGTYKITARSQTVSVTKKLAVMHVLSLSNVKVKRTAKKITIKATLKKVNGKYLKGKKITFRFNGKKYAAKTNKKGVAKITVKKNVLKKLRKGKKVTYQATYLKDTVKKSVKVR